MLQTHVEEKITANDYKIALASIKSPQLKHYP